MGRIFRYSGFDAVLVALVIGYAGIIAALAVHFAQLRWYVLLAIGIVLPVLDLTAQNAQHYHAHTRFFVPKATNFALNLLLSALYGYPQKVYRFRHMWHHRHTYPYRS